ncbi:hypothetical protein JOE38_001131 [Clavibacter michiganensis]|uniref:hypothetical protein n=1 Tax=Clavibacter michiganensis TaxID=28447 RepID=UPI00195F0BE2|nr:hypothetical protein [Clavibacter michiganensis]MBM7411308.1 hypothetical protein [Clavibacter michiganensis]
MTPDATRRRALRDAAVLTAFYLVAELVIVPIVVGGTATERLAPALVCGALVFASTCLIGRAARRSRRDRG